MQFDLKIGCVQGGALFGHDLLWHSLYATVITADD
jgi:hypothetical protein